MQAIPTDQIHDIVTWNDATMQGILMLFLISLAIVVIFLFKTNQKLYKDFTTERDKMYSVFSSDREKLYREHIAEIRQFNDLLVKITTQYYEVSNNFLRYNK
jgi:hypothetical protein